MAGGRSAARSKYYNESAYQPCAWNHEEKKVSYLTASGYWRCLSGQAIYCICRVADMQLHTQETFQIQLFSALFAVHWRQGSSDGNAWLPGTGLFLGGFCGVQIAKDMPEPLGTAGNMTGSVPVSVKLYIWAREPCHVKEVVFCISRKRGSVEIGRRQGQRASALPQQQTVPARCMHDVSVSQSITRRGS